MNLAALTLLPPAPGHGPTRALEDPMLFDLSMLIGTVAVGAAEVAASDDEAPETQNAPDANEAGRDPADPGTMVPLSLLTVTEPSPSVPTVKASEPRDAIRHSRVIARPTAAASHHTRAGAAGAAALLQPAAPAASAERLPQPDVTGPSTHAALAQHMKLSRSGGRAEPATTADMGDGADPPPGATGGLVMALTGDSWAGVQPEPVSAVLLQQPETRVPATRRTAGPDNVGPPAHAVVQPAVTLVLPVARPIPARSAQTVSRLVEESASLAEPAAHKQGYEPLAVPVALGQTRASPARDPEQSSGPAPASDLRPVLPPVPEPAVVSLRHVTVAARDPSGPPAASESLDRAATLPALPNERSTPTVVAGTAPPDPVPVPGATPIAPRTPIVPAIAPRDAARMEKGEQLRADMTPARETVREKWPVERSTVTIDGQLPGPDIGSVAAVRTDGSTGLAIPVSSNMATSPSPITPSQSTTQLPVVDVDSGGAWIDRIALEIGAAANGGGARLKLSPENLGELTIAIEPGDAGASVVITAQDESVRSLLVGAQDRLVNEARANGVRLVDVQTQLSGDSGTGTQHQHRPARDPVPTFDIGPKRMIWNEIDNHKEAISTGRWA